MKAIIVLISAVAAVKISDGPNFMNEKVNGMQLDSEQDMWASLAKADPKDLAKAEDENADLI